MNVLRLVVCILWGILACATSVLAANAGEPTKITSILHLAWTFLNSSAGVTLVGAVCAFILGKVFTKKPKWKVYYAKYHGDLISAVKQAEKNIPDDSPDKGPRRLNAALQFVIEVAGKVDESEMKRAVKVVHAELESTKNL